VALAGVILTWGIRDYELRRAVAAMESQLYQNETPLRVSSYPYWGNPFRWYGVVETAEFYATTHVDSLTPEVNPESNLRIVYKPEENPVTAAARQTYLGRVYFGWAQYPVTETEKLPDPPGGYSVRLYDLRFGYPEIGARRTLSAEVQLDSQLHEVSEGAGVVIPKRKPEK
jgi:inner membrane protein